MPRKKTAIPSKITITLSEDERSELAKAARAYPDAPSPKETARRLIDMQLFQKRRGG